MARLRNGKTWHCKVCNLLFPSKQEFEEHRDTMRKQGKQHYHCSVCSIDFQTERGEVLHKQMDHPEKQDLTCPGCGEGPFTRAGALMQHIENECKCLSAETIEQLRDEKIEFGSRLVQLCNDPVQGNYSKHIWPAKADEPKVPVIGTTEDLFAEKLEMKEFPSLSGFGFTAGEISARAIKAAETKNLWAESKKLFDAPPAQKPTSEQLQSVTAANARAAFNDEAAHNPYHPHFRVEACYSKWNQKYNCPKQFCNKGFKSAGALLGHLKSEAHRGKIYTCPYCFQKFTSLSAMTQHAESNGKACRMRNATDYGAYMDQLTAGIIEVDINRHSDGTVKFNNTSKGPNPTIMRSKKEEIAVVAVAEKPVVEKVKVPDSWW